MKLAKALLITAIMASAPAHAIDIEALSEAGFNTGHNYGAEGHDFSAAAHRGDYGQARSVLNRNGISTRDYLNYHIQNEARPNVGGIFANDRTASVISPNGLIRANDHGTLINNRNSSVFVTPGGNVVKW